MRLIDADALIEKFEKLKEGSKLQDVVFLDGAQAVVDSMPEYKPLLRQSCLRKEQKKKRGKT